MLSQAAVAQKDEILCGAIPIHSARHLCHSADHNLESGLINGVRSIECNSFTKSPEFAEVKGKSI